MTSLSIMPEAPAARWIKRWPANLAVLGSSPTGGGNLFNRKWGFIEHSHSLSPSHLPVTAIVLKMKVKLQVKHPSINAGFS